ncbi:MAG: Glycerol-3-phosphate responsive antiterminator [Thermotoga sp. 50_1627]|uniref:glycerol-3-phosphate responsive antiterminator n=1 Tax=Pseudothermotoga sp. TaxID=2033661 RepID=UPI00076CC471|nr:MAG: Glycerol-3-phosphate responsive antiterminator [Thermotoga sp. 50_64]KUK25451.1 MAG: Glycerol-3-phosphate responsive antiterminator [Thermotoga sp. 50_1627]MBC7115726.1 glycerol-3-phosphate responsive antiterminator [Pseudothermotoga sp.]MDK2923434.1 glycerol uptake operon antiterminator [Pseudothermotoga sp.]HBT39010.1 glycerol-3-phosphate responsive antiterminator [Pseudothermotoga sp.]
MRDEKYFAHPVVPALRSEEQLQRAAESMATSVFLLYGDLMNLKSVVKYLHDHGKKVFVHLDLIKGLGRDENAVEYLKAQILVDGMITTKGNLVTVAKKVGLVPIQRIFLLDSQSLATGIAQIKSHRPDYIEVLPGLIPDLIQRIVQETNIPVITGGLIKTVQQALEALKKGAMAISTSEESLWNLKLS